MKKNNVFETDLFKGLMSKLDELSDVDNLKSKRIKQILCKVKHPQSNGKIERWFACYYRNRHAFDTKEKFMYWYNDLRPHRALKFDKLETPSQAFVRKLKR